jgi:ribosomal protein S3
MNSVNIHKSHYYAVPEWIESARQSFITCKPSDIYFSNCTFKDDTDTDVEFWVVCERPGIFIGTRGENIDYWRDLLQAYIDKWCEATTHDPIKLSIRIKERDLFAYESSVISL